MRVPWNKGKRSPTTPLRKAFGEQLRNARRRGIPFLLTFEDWLILWKKSGKLYERGVGHGKYCMSRRGDKGAYTIGNVAIILHTKNIIDGNTGHHRGGWKLSDESRARIAAASARRKHTEQSRAKMRVLALRREASKRNRSTLHA